MKRGFVVAVGGAAIVVAGLSGCSDDKKESSDSATTTVEATSAAPTSEADSTASAGSGATKVTIDGKAQEVQGTVACQDDPAGTKIGFVGGASGIGAVVGDGDSPVVKSVALGNVDGVVLGYAENDGQGNATATKVGDTYTITGTASGVDLANPMNFIKKPFEMTVTCPD